MLPARGRPGLALLMSITRSLTAEDLVSLSLTDPVRTGPPTIQRIRASHVAAARHLASGKTIKETAFLVGRTPQRISDLTRDPTFQELTTYYRDQITEIDLNEAEQFQTALKDIATLATDEITDRLEDPQKRAEIPTAELRQLAQFGLDRTVAPPKTAVPAQSPPPQITFNMGARDIRPPALVSDLSLPSPDNPSADPGPISADLSPGPPSGFPTRPGPAGVPRTPAHDPRTPRTPVPASILVVDVEDAE